MHITITSKLISNLAIFLSQTCRINTQSANLTNKLKYILDSARSHSITDRFSDITPLYVLRLQSISLINDINSSISIENDCKSVLGKAALALLHCYSNHRYLDSEFARLLLNNIYLKTCSPRALLTVLESLQKSNLMTEMIPTIFNKFLGNQKTLLSLSPQDMCQLLWRFIAIHQKFPFFTANKYYYTIGTLIMHCRKRINYSFRNHNKDNRIAWSAIGANRALDDFSMAIKLFSHSDYCKSKIIATFDDDTIRDNLSNLYLSQLNAINELLAIPNKSQFRQTNISDTARKVINSLQELLQSCEITSLLHDYKIYYESPVIGTNYSIDILIIR